MWTLDRIERIDEKTCHYTFEKNIVSNMMRRSIALHFHLAHELAEIDAYRCHIRADFRIKQKPKLHGRKWSKGAW